MEQQTINSNVKSVAGELPAIVDNMEIVSSGKAFIEANTVESSLSEIRNKHIIPVFLKDNEPVISHAEFIEVALSTTMDVYRGETVLKPSIRLSHPIKGRIPDAKHKAASELQEHEKTIYYERMAFVIEVPTIYHDIDGNMLTLTIGGVKAYNLDNLYNKAGTDQHFKIFVGFKNMVCCNLCVATDGYQSSLKVKTIDMLKNNIKSLIQDFDAVRMAKKLEELSKYSITEQQFANLIGRCRMYRYLPENQKEQVPELLFGDSHINAVCNDYYRDGSFCKNDDGNLSLWKLYNLLTSANKSSYIDTFLDRGVNALQMAYALKSAVQHKEQCWFLQ